MEGCEKLSIRDSAKTLKKYGSTSKHVVINQNSVKHKVSSSDTLQGIALRYGVTTEQIRRVNRLWATDSLFLREFLTIPVQNGTPTSPEIPQPLTSPTSPQYDEDDEDISNFLIKIDSSIASTKEEVRKTCGNSEFTLNYDNRKPVMSRVRQTLNNNTPQTVVVSQGRKMRSSLQRLEQQQDELFEL